MTVIHINNLNEIQTTCTVGSNEEYYIGIPDHEIVAVDKQYVSNKPNIYCLKEGSKMYNARIKMTDCNTMNIVDSEGNEQFMCIKKDRDRVIIYNKDNTPILNTFVNDDFKKMYIYKGENETEKLVTIETSSQITNDIQKCRIHFHNIASNENEELEMRYSKSTLCNYIYCNKGKANETIIGAIKVDNRLKNECTVEISPMVDTMLLLSLSTVVVNFLTVKNDIKKKKEFYLDFCSCCCLILIFLTLLLMLLLLIILIKSFNTMN